MPIQSEGHVPLQIFEPSWFWKQLPKDKQIVNNMCYIWYNHIVSFMIRMFSASNHQLLNSTAFAARWARDRRVYTALGIIYNQSHMILLSLLMQWPIRGVQMSQMSSGRALADSIPWRIRNNKVQKIDIHFTVQTASETIWEFLRQKSW